MTSSLCPQIYGHEMVKSALVLSLFGGTNKVDKEDNSIRIRGQIHILIVGDHGSGKDLLLKSVNSISHKSQYVFGNTSTLNGLTANIVKHKNKHFIEKGSLLLSNSGYYLFLFTFISIFNFF
jgi:DNA replicative helicase MCM subunit Mcm2 (Cdc46/Mcm family)